MLVWPAQGAVLDRILGGRGGRVRLTRQATARLHAALTKTPWGRRDYRTVALVEGSELRASADLYRLQAILDGRAVTACGIGSLTLEPPHQNPNHLRHLLDLILEQAARDGAAIGILFPHSASPAGSLAPFEPIPVPELVLAVAEPARYGAPMTMVRAGDDRDLPAIVAMGRTRAAPWRFHLDRDVEFVQFAITEKRLAAGLGAMNARQLQFFIAEEGTTAAAYVVLTVSGGTWTLEECGDRDPSGARVGALLQALIAREPIERRPEIRAWLPAGFLPPQVSIISSSPAADLVGMCALGCAKTTLPVESTFFWHGDLP
jgi:hypothetical protein